MVRDSRVLEVGDRVRLLANVIAADNDGTFGAGAFKANGTEVGEIVGFDTKMMVVLVSIDARAGKVWRLFPSELAIVDVGELDVGELDPAEEIEKCLEALR